VTRRGASLLLAVLALAAPPARAAAVCPSHWVGTWAASPSDASVQQPLADQTLRMIVGPHLAGDTVRVRLSNRFGTSPVTLGPVTVATAASGAAIVPGSLRKVTFAGRPAVTIPAGREVVSDPAPFAVRPFEHVAVSVAVPGAIAQPTEHFFTRQQSYLTPSGTGDHSGDAAGAAFALPTNGVYSHGWYFLDGLDVRAPGTTGAVSAFGDSITDGVQGLHTIATEDQSHNGDDGRYPDDLARRLLAAGRPLSVLNAGIGSNQLLKDAGPGLSNGGQSGLSRFTADVLDRPGVTDVIVLDEVNDIAQPSSPATAQELIDGLRKVIAMAHARGVRVQLGTITPFGGVMNPFFDHAVAEATRQRLNAWIRGRNEADGVVDFDAAVRDPTDPTRIDPRYDGSDHLHLNPLGYQAMAQAVPLDRLAGGRCAGGRA
jgi:lysophospholipase L1-like esterase